MFDDSEISRLLMYIPEGRNNAINAAELAAELGYSAHPNQEELRELIRQAIQRGALIGSSNVGYWIINSKDEAEEVLNSLQRRAQGVCERRNNLLAAWNRNYPEDVCTLPVLDVKP